MHQLLEKYLVKLGIKDAIELRPDERETFAEWQRILSKDELTLDDIKQFCKLQTLAIESKWRDLNLDQSKKGELIPYHTVYNAILVAIDSPKVGREALEKQLTQKINT